MRKSAKEEDGSYWYELSKKEIKSLVLKRYGKIIKKTEKVNDVEVGDGVAIMVSPRKTKT